MSAGFRGPTLILLFLLALPAAARAEDGYDFWLRYPLVSDAALRARYRASITGAVLVGNSATMAVARRELSRGLRGQPGEDVPPVDDIQRDGIILAAAGPLAVIQARRLQNRAGAGWC